MDYAWIIPGDLTVLIGLTPVLPEGATVLFGVTILGIMDESGVTLELPRVLTVGPGPAVGAFVVVGPGLRVNGTEIKIININWADIPCI